MCLVYYILIDTNLPPVSDDIRNVDLSKVHNLSGPIAVEGAEPGDCLVVDILDSEFQRMEPETCRFNGSYQSTRLRKCLGDILSVLFQTSCRFV